MNNNIDNFLKGCVSNKNFADITTMHVGGKISHLFIAKTQEQLKNAVQIAQENHIDYIVVGNGSNIIASDEEFKGLIIKNESSNLIVGNNEVIADSGIKLPVLVKKLAEKNLGNLEFLAGIPGTLGGAVLGNAGAFGKSLSNVVKSILVLGSDSKVHSMSAEDLHFGYRSTILKENIIHEGAKNHPVILSINLKVIPKQKEMILRIIDNYMRMRQSKYPNYASSGSFFKNILVQDYPEIAQKNNIVIVEDKVPAGVLLESVGAKTMKYGGACIFDKHANFIINKFRKAKAFDIQYHFYQRNNITCYFSAKKKRFRVPL